MVRPPCLLALRPLAFSSWCLFFLFLLERGVLCWLEQGGISRTDSRYETLKTWSPSAFPPSAGFRVASFLRIWYGILLLSVRLTLARLNHWEPREASTTPRAWRANGMKKRGFRWFELLPNQMSARWRWLEVSSCACRVSICRLGELWWLDGSFKSRVGILRSLSWSYSIAFLIKKGPNNLLGVRKTLYADHPPRNFKSSAIAEMIEENIQTAFIVLRSSFVHFLCQGCNWRNAIAWGTSVDSFLTSYAQIVDSKCQIGCI